MRKKLWCLLLSFVFSFACAPWIAADADEIFKVYLYDNFESGVLGKKPVYKDGYWTGDNLKVEYCSYIKTVEDEQRGGKVLHMYSQGKGEDIASCNGAISATPTFREGNIVLDGWYMMGSPNGLAGVLLRGATASEIIRLFTFSGGNLYDGSEAGTLIGTAKPGEWVRVSVVFHTGNKSYKIFVNGEQKNTGFYKGSIVLTNALEFRTYLQGSTENGVQTDFYMDNVRLYDGEAVRPDSDFSEQPQELGLNDWSDLTTFLKPNASVLINDSDALIGLERRKIDAKNGSIVPVKLDGVTYIPAQFVAEYLDGSFSYDMEQNIGTIQWEGNKVSFSLTDTAVTRNAKAYQLKNIPKLVNGKVYLPIEECAAAAGFFATVYEDLAVFGSKSVYFHDENQYMQIKYYIKGEKSVSDAEANYEMPSMQEIISDFKAHTAGEHPRLLATKEDFDRIKKDVEEVPVVGEWYQNLMERAEKELLTEPYTYRSTDGVRMDAATNMRRFEILALLYNLNGDKRYVDKLWEDMEAICQYEDWQPDMFLLCANMTGAMSLAYDWVYDALTPEQRRTIEETIMRLGLQEAMSAYRREVLPGEDPIATRARMQWLNDNSNWTAVCNSGIAMGAIALFDTNEEFCAEILQHSLESIESFYASVSPDGGCVEGSGYWLYSRQWFVKYVAALETALGTDYGRYNYAGFDRTGYFPIYMQNEAGGFGFSDSNNLSIICPEYMYIGMRNQDKGLISYRTKSLVNKDEEPWMYDLLWFRRELYSEESIDLDLDYYFRNVETGSLRSSFGDPYSTMLAFHGGSNGASHAHIDCGTFALYSDGQRWIEDMGKDSLTYVNPDGVTFTGDQLYRIRPEGHNCVVINPSLESGQSGRGFAPVERIQSSKEGGLAVVNLASPYEQYVKSYRRAYTLTDDRRRSTIQDEIVMKEPSTMYWFAHTMAEVEILSGGKAALMTLNGRRMWVTLTCSDPNARLDVMKAGPLPTSPQVTGQAGGGSYRKLFIRLDDVTEVDLAVTFIPLRPDDAIPSKSYKYTKIDDIRMSDNSKEFPMLDGIAIDGEPIAGFNPRTREYSFRLPYETEKMPEVEAVSDNYKVELERQEEQLPWRTVVTVRNEDTGETSKYFITFTRLPKTGLNSVNGELSFTSFEVSDTPQPEYPKENMHDGNLTPESRWSSEGAQWALYDLGEVREVTEVALAYWQGNARIAYFDVYTSLDKENWELVASGQSSGQTADFETYRLLPSKARYVRFNFHATNVSNWNSITELKIFGK